MKNPLRTLALSILIALAALPWIFPIPQPALAACTFLCNDGAGNGEFGANLQVDGNLTVLGTTTGGVYQTSGLRITGTTALVPNSTEGTLYASATGGGVFRGSGSTYDISLLDQTGTTQLGVNNGAGTAGVIVANNLGVGTALSPNSSRIRVGGTYPVASNQSLAINTVGTWPATATTLAVSYMAQAATANAGATYGQAALFYASRPVTTGDTVTNLDGVFIENLQEGATNSGIRCTMTNNSARRCLNLTGTAQNDFGGGLLMKGTTAITPTSSQGTFYASTTEGGVFRGSGSGADFALKNQAGTTVIGNVTNTALMTIGATAFGSLGTPANGSFAYCNDCTIANPCAGGGNGAFAKRLNGAWVCN